MMNNLEQIEGIWEGYMKIPYSQFEIIVELGNNEGSISVLSFMGRENFQLSNIQIKEESIKFEANVFDDLLKFEGALENNKISGSYTKNENGELLSFEFELIRGKKRNIVDIHLENGILKAEIKIPSGDGKFPLMVIVDGNDPVNFGSNSHLLNVKEKILDIITEDLLKHGIASIIYDKRGFGMNFSLGLGKNLTVDSLVKDAVECIKYAKNDERFSHVGVIGYNEGSLIGMLATLEAKADIFISLAGFGRKADQVIIENLKSRNLSDALIEEAKSIIDKLINDQFVENVLPELNMSLFVQPYLISRFKYDPSKIIQNIEVPILIVNGKRDIHVPESEAKSLHESNPKSRLLLFENMNHVFKDSPTDIEGNILTYSNPDLPLSDGFLEGLTNFILENTSK